MKNDSLLKAEALLTCVSFLNRKKKDPYGNLSANFIKVSKSGILGRHGLIDNQSALSDIAIGRSNMAAAGCEVIAVYNLLNRFSEGEKAVELPDLIECFERNGVVLGGIFGVLPQAMKRLLRDLGLKTNFTSDPSDFDVLAHYCPDIILTVMNDGTNIFKQVHSFYVRRESAGDGSFYFRPYNAGIRDRFSSIENLIRALPGGKAKGISMIG
ncbi:MAG: hypothetical protein IJS84_06605, partial [Spirochaetales bacterium]|nr:hypothetical protein [Spirochaetales bacterium]